MAEYVEQRMEEMIPEMEELERVGILSNTEVKELVKKRKHFEYKIQKRTKQKGDFLGYIEYESNLLTLIQLRREEIGYHHKKSKIENTILNRINKLFKILCHRWQSDVKIWLSHIDWLKRVKWTQSVSKVNLRLLQVHNNNPSLWIAAAKFEFDNGSAETGRQLLLRGLRFHPQSKLIHREYVKFELLFVETLRARSKVLKLDDDEEKKDVSEPEEGAKPVTEDTGVLSDVDSENGADQSKEKDAFQRHKANVEAEVNDSILNCELVNLVVQAAIEAIPQADFAVSLLVTIRKFPFAKKVEEELLELLHTKFPNDPVTIDTKARMALEKEGKTTDLITACAAEYRQGLETSPSAQLFNLAFSTLKSLASRVPPTSGGRVVMRELLALLAFGRDSTLLSEHAYEFWLKLINVEDNLEQVEVLLADALAQFPGHLEFWCLRLTLDLAVADQSEQEKAYRASIKRAFEKIDNRDREKLWNRFVLIMNKCGKADTAYQLLTEAVEKENSGELRVLLLERSREKGVDKSREIYSKYSLLPPFNKDLHLIMLNIELEQLQMNKKNIRNIFMTLCGQFGAENVDLWIKWIDWERTHGRVLDVPNIVCRAEASLNKNLINQFTSLRETHTES